MLKIKDISGRVLITAAIGTGSKRGEKINLADDFVTLKFSLRKPVFIPLGAYCDIPGEGRFEACAEYRPVFNRDTAGYDYELKLEAPYMKWRNKIFKFTPASGGREASWSLTATLATHLRIFLDNLTALGYRYSSSTDYDFSVDNTVEDSAKLISYENTDMLSALIRMADEWECDVWMEDNIIKFGRCEYGSGVEFEEGVNADKFSISGNRSVHATRIYAFGSTRNLPPSYRPTSENITVNGVVQKRLMLPAGTPYVDANPGMATEEAIEGVVVFDDVYPRTQGNIDTVSTIERTVENEDGTETAGTFYRFKDSGITFSKDYILDGEELHVVFQSGKLNGMDFGVIFNPEAKDEKLPDGSWNPKAQLWEIVATDNYGRTVPDGTLIPKEGDKYVLYGWDSTKIADLGLVTAAEKELLAKAKKYVERTKIDPNTYSCTLRPKWLLDQFNDDEYVNPYRLGRRVTLKSTAYFATGERKSRIIGYEYPLDIPYDHPVYSVGESPAYTRLSAVEDKVEALTLKGQAYAATGGNSVYLITTGDTTIPTDRNAYSALRSRREFLSKARDDRSAGRIAADGGFEAGRYVAGLAGGLIDERGNLEMESGVYRSYVKIFELIYNRLNALEGDTSFADSGTIEAITANADGSLTALMRRRWDGDFTAFQPGDILYGYANDIVRDAQTGALRQNTRGLTWFKAWARVTAVDRTSNTLTLLRYAAADVPAKVNFDMTAGMTVSRWGNVIAPTAESASNPDYASFIRQRADGSYVNTRQQSFYLSCEQGHLMELVGVDSPILRPGNYGTVLGQLPEGLITDPAALQLINSGQPYLYARGIVVQDLIRIGYQGVQVRTPNFRGRWDAATAASETEYYRRADDLEDITSHDGALWQCAASHASALPPSDSNPDWVRLTDFNIRVWAIVPSTNVIYIRRDSYSTGLLECRVTVDNGGSTVRISTPEQLDTYGARLCFSLDGVTYREFWVRQGDTVGGLTTATGESLEMGGNNVPWSQINDFIYLYVIDNTSGAQLASYRVAVVRDGSDGSDGNDGQTPPHIETRYAVTNSSGTAPAINKDQRDPSTATVKWRTGSPQATSLQYVWQTTATIDADDNPVTPWGDPVRLTGTTGRKGDPGKDGIGRLAYPCGAFDSNVTYVSTDTMQPVVLDGQQFYILKPSKTYRGAEAPEARNTPSKDYAAGGDGVSWEWMERMKYVFAEIVMAEMAKLGSFVFSGTSMFSQQGVYDKDGETDLESTSYQHYGDGFTPNFEVDGKTGRVKARHGEFSGWFRLSEVVITPGNIGGYGHIVDQDSTTVTYQLRCSETGTMLRFRGDFATGYGDGTKRCRIQLLLPYMDYLCSDGRPDEIRAYCGSSALIINESVTVEGGTSSWGSTSGDRGGSASRPVAGRSDLVIIGAIATQPTGNGTFNHDIPLKPGWAVHLRAELGYAEEMGAADPTVMYEQLVWRTSGAVKMRTTILDA